MKLLINISISCIILYVYNILYLKFCYFYSYILMK